MYLNIVIRCHKVSQVRSNHKRSPESRHVLILLKTIEYKRIVSFDSGNSLTIQFSFKTRHLLPLEFFSPPYTVCTVHYPNPPPTCCVLIYLIMPVQINIAHISYIFLSQRNFLKMFYFFHNPPKYILFIVLYCFIAPRQYCIYSLLLVLLSPDQYEDK